MKVLVIGSGGREHALAWALKRSPGVKRVFNASGNAGLRGITEAVAVDASDLNAVADFAARESIDLTVVGPEQPLVDGIADLFGARGLPVFGPSRAAARLEGSKVFAKEFMQRHRIPTARFRVVDNPEDAIRIVASGEFGYPVVIKADGLAAGKGVILAQDEAEARTAIAELMVEQRLGSAGERLVIEECLAGREASYMVFSDGVDYAAMPVAQDHKRAFDGDRGPNTGGMGAFSLPGLIDGETERRICREVVEPALEGARRDGMEFRGVLYCGVMLTAEGPQTLEFNVRMGDPETQAILRRFDGDLGEICLAAAGGDLSRVKGLWSAAWSVDAATCIVLASAGYPGSYKTGHTITGIPHAEQIEGVVVFHAGTRGSDGSVETAGGRVLGVTARATDLPTATARAYEAVERIAFDGMQFRRDIGR
ncbi:MAG: phosphoribosylamine--glycine ligase [Acidobacteria bacterium]|nr:phosphoribosylamine--glycine ligase [Acidobacteriota bacterium]